MTKEIYVAGALFSAAERSYLEWMVNHIAEGTGLNPLLNFYLPHRDAKSQLGDELAIFQDNMIALRHASLVIAVVDGKDVDSGVSWEIGYSFHKTTPVYGLRTDKRSIGPGKFSDVNLMVRFGMNYLDPHLDDLINHVKQLKDRGCLLHDHDRHERTA